MQASQRYSASALSSGYQTNPFPRRPLFDEITTYPLSQTAQTAGPIHLVRPPPLVKETVSPVHVSQRTFDRRDYMDNPWHGASGLTNATPRPVWPVTGRTSSTSESITEFRKSKSIDPPQGYSMELRATDSVYFPPQYARSLECQTKPREVPLPLPLRREEPEISPLGRRNIPDVTTTTPDKICNFCKTNGEMKRVYLSHKLMERGKIVCPVLRRYICPLCGATGDNAHTVSYCPFGSGTTFMATARTPRKGCGCKRVCKHGQQRHH